MASSLTEGPSPESRQQQFEQGIAISLHLWQSLTIAVQNNWGGPDSSDKRDWLAGVIVDMFPSFVDLATKSQSKKLPEEPVAEEIEETLLQVMFDEFEANVDDQSEAEVADRIMKCRTQCAAGNFALVEELRARWLDTKGKKVVAQAAADPDQDTDWESGSDDNEDDDGESGSKDVDMDDAPALVPVVPREKPQPEIDEDGFEKVSRRRR
ncbi:Pre-rRNA-processing protein TSR2-domain-containing protein [Xylaria bambusicola]|uniref:Pre-rRNA-processing protein TSR2-domain-containing protein n=1 Tax=Xylaria bambusicola TaxID=326684 RepID=UPI002008EA16|nr:Pre-rRNA-processing protein TSR2-domain-containing protein [Xylaria bambusicola]KAI0506058.1 Pre-rRNA-processing protein TSR2-domain-containing protein [Xylaria bambusicola]